MDVVVRTGRTKAQRGTTLLSRLLEGEKEEKIFFLLHVQAKAEDVKKFEEDCVTVLTQSILETEGESLQKVDGALKEINGLLRGFVSSEGLQDLHLIVAFLDGEGLLHVSHAGRAEAYILRGGSVSQITEYTKGRHTSAFAHIASGQLESRDTLVLSTQRLLRSITPAQLVQHSQHNGEFLDAIKSTLETEGEQAALVTLRVDPSSLPLGTSALPKRGRRSRTLPSSVFSSFSFLSPSALRESVEKIVGGIWSVSVLSRRCTQFFAYLVHPKRQPRAHLLILAGSLTMLLIVWVVVQVSFSSQKGKVRTELSALIEQTNGELRTAKNRHLAGDTNAANALLERAESRTKQVMDHESGLFRVEALDLLDRIRSTREDINNVVRLSPRIVVNLSTKGPAVATRGFFGLDDGEFIVYDTHSLYRVLLNTVDEPQEVAHNGEVLRGVAFSRYQTWVFLLAENGVTEVIAGQPVSMKTEDPAGWVSGNDIETYLRYLYILSPKNNQVYKYERLGNRYTAPVSYNVNGDLVGAIDMTIDSNVYILKEGGEVLKLFRGEVQPFSIRKAPDGILDGVTKLFKVFDGNLYLLNPTDRRVIVVGGGAGGEVNYLKQYVFEGEQLGELKDIYVNPDETHLYLLDEKRVYTVDLGTK